MNLRSVLMAVAVLLASSPSVPALAASGDTALRASLQRAITSYLATYAKSEHISAISLSVSLPGEADDISMTAGRRSWNAGGPIATDDLWQIGSNTKAFTAVALLQLEAEGKLTIDQTVGHWLPQYPAWKDVSIRRLLDMTSGIPGYDNVPAMGYAQTTIHRRWTPEQLIAFADPIYPGAPKPTQKWDYSNTNYLLAGLIIERVTGDSYGEELQHRFFEPLGLSHTFYSPNIYPRSVTERMVSGYWFNSGPGNEPFKRFLGDDMRLCDMSWAGAAGGIVSMPEDVIRWVRALYKGNILAPKQRAELLRVVSLRTGKPIATTSLADPAGFGLGVGESTKPKLGTFWFYQGETLGYRMIYAYLPKSDIVFALGINSQPTTNHAGELMSTIWDALHAAGKT
jgi:D-alanyl-D-alanine carboxypeptidase